MNTSPGSTWAPVMDLQFEYGQSALAYDTSFTLYNALPVADRPYRIMWYQTGPYKAYYYTSRYQDVITLADIQ